MTVLLRLARPKQWIKNTFVLAPLVFARVYADPKSVGLALLTSALFCVASSAFSRPLAAGAISVRRPSCCWRRSMAC